MIFESRVRELGIRRSIMGAFSIYTSIPFLVLFHAVCICSFVVPVAMLLKLNKYKQTQFIVIDRYKLKSLSLIDKLNCAYCDYANGIATYYRYKIKEYFEYSGSINWWKKVIIYTLYQPYIVTLTVYRWHAKYLYEDFVFPSMDHRPLSVIQAVKKIGGSKHAFKANNDVIARLLKKERVFSFILSDGLSAIESYWCPIRHYIEEGKIYSEMHKLYFDPRKSDDEFSLMDALRKKV
jgi:hypothetical protein